MRWLQRGTRAIGLVTLFMVGLRMFSQSHLPVEIPGSRVRVLFHSGALESLGQISRAQGATRILLVTDPGIRKAGHPERALRSIYRAGLVARVFDEVEENPTTKIVGEGLRIAKEFKPDFIIGLGGGSSMDCAKGINFLYSNGGKMQAYWGVNKATQPMLPLIAIPTTAGTGSDAQSFALITDPETHQKMACGDLKALARMAILDPELTATQPARVAAATGIDAISHAVETAVTAKRNDTSLKFSKEAWELLSRSFEQSLSDPSDQQARADMLLGAHLAGCAIENSMLGAAHALANPLTAQFGLPHGFAVGMMLPHVVRFNAEPNDGYGAALGVKAEGLIDRLKRFLEAGHIRQRLSDHDIPEHALPGLAADAATQWTATFNPRPADEGALLKLYRAAF
jgi:alcohol dehydrogenase